MQRNTVFLLTSNQLTNPRFSHLQGKMSVHKNCILPGFVPQGMADDRCIT